MKTKNQVKEELDKTERILEWHDNSDFGGLICQAIIRSKRDTLRWVLQLQSYTEKAINQK